MRAITPLLLCAAILASVAIPGFAATNNMCVQNCLNHGKLYQQCVAACSDGVPAPAAQKLPAPGESPRAAPGAQLPGGSQPTGSQPPTAQRPAQSPREDEATPRAAAIQPLAPVHRVDYRCVFACKDRGRSYDECVRVCTAP
jgi:hypothetical protein